MVEKKAKKVERYKARVERYLDPVGSILTLRLGKKRNGTFVVGSRKKKADGSILKGQSLAFRTEPEAVEKFESLDILAVSKGWTRKESRSRYDYEGIPDSEEAVPAKKGKVNPATA